LNQTPRNLFTAKWTFAFLLAFLFGLGAFLRFSDLSAPLLDFHPTRQLFSAIKARGIYYQTLPDAPAWQKDLAIRQYTGEATIEPPILDHLAATLYTYFGQENTAYPRAISAAFWLLAAVFLFQLSKNLTNSSSAAFFSLAFFLFLPYAITASRAFQPDPLMVLLILVFWWAMERSAKSPPAWPMPGQADFAWAILAGTSGGLAIFVKFPAVFFIAGGAIGALLAHSSLKDSIKSPKTWVIAILCILPPAAYLYYGLSMGGFLDQQFGSRFYPELWVSPYFYLRWFLTLSNVMNVIWLSLAILGWLVFANKPTKIFISGLWISYIIYGFVFAHHISSHDYYSLPFIPVVALSIAPLAAEFLPVFSKILQPSRFYQLITFSLLLLTLSLTSINQYLNMRTNDYRPQAAFWAEVGNVIGHQPGVVALTTDYGYPLAYYGWQNSNLWPLAPDIKNFDDVFARLTKGKSYFLVTDFDEYNRQPELRKRLNENYSTIAQENGYLVFDLYHPKK
jgi:4-amino-4-deoxy-L-arabinose transferase-like glycosyltransferase